MKNQQGNIFNRCLLFCLRRAVSLIRMLIAGGAVGFIIFLNVNNIANSSRGVDNLIILAVCFSFFPLFFALLVEFFLSDMRRKRKKLKESNTRYLNL